MNKPTKVIRKPIYDYSDCTRYIESKYKIRTRDYAKSHSQFFEWCDKKGYGEIDPSGKKRGESTIWFAEYRLDLATGIVKELPYQDFWHWLLEAYGVHNGSVFTIDNDSKSDKNEPWVNEIIEMYLSEFGEGPNREVEFRVEW